jgi:hypothetical protein
MKHAIKFKAATKADIEFLKKEIKRIEEFLSNTNKK